MKRSLLIISLFVGVILSGCLTSEPTKQVEYIYVTPEPMKQVEILYDGYIKFSTDDGSLYIFHFKNVDKAEVHGDTASVTYNGETKFFSNVYAYEIRPHY